MQSLFQNSWGGGYFTITAPHPPSPAALGCCAVYMHESVKCDNQNSLECGWDQAEEVGEVRGRRYLSVSPNKGDVGRGTGSLNRDSKSGIHLYDTFTACIHGI